MRGKARLSFSRVRMEWEWWDYKKETERLGVKENVQCSTFSCKILGPVSTLNFIYCRDGTQFREVSRLSPSSQIYHSQSNCLTAMLENLTLIEEEWMNRSHERYGKQDSGLISWESQGFRELLWLSPSRSHWRAALADGQAYKYINIYFECDVLGAYDSHGSVWSTSVDQRPARVSERQGNFRRPEPPDGRGYSEECFCYFSGLQGKV